LLLAAAAWFETALRRRRIGLNNEHRPASAN